MEQSSENCEPLLCLLVVMMGGTGGSEGEELDRALASNPGTPWCRTVWDAELQRVVPN